MLAFLYLMACICFAIGAFSLGSELFPRQAKTPEARRKSLLTGFVWLLMAFSIMSYIASR